MPVALSDPKPLPPRSSSIAAVPAVLRSGACASRWRIMQATAVAAALSGAPSTLEAFRRQRDFRSVMNDVWDATLPDRHIRPAGPAGFVRGALLHVGVSVLSGEGLARTVPESRSVIWSGGAAIGVINRSDWTAVSADCGASARSPTRGQRRLRRAFAFVVDR
jgi:hypothetical protein